MHFKKLGMSMQKLNLISRRHLEQGVDGHEDFMVLWYHEFMARRKELLEDAYQVPFLPQLLQFSGKGGEICMCVDVGPGL